jgi:hypothetical protein
MTTAKADSVATPAPGPERCAGFEAALPLLLNILGIDREKLRP